MTEKVDIKAPAKKPFRKVEKKSAKRSFSGFPEPDSSTHNEETEDDRHSQIDFEVDSPTKNYSAQNEAS